MTNKMIYIGGYYIDPSRIIGAYKDEHTGRTVTMLEGGHTATLETIEAAADVLERLGVR